MLSRNENKDFVFTCDSCGKVLMTNKKVPIHAVADAQQRHRWRVIRLGKYKWQHHCLPCWKYIG